MFKNCDMCGGCGSQGFGEPCDMCGGCGVMVAAEPDPIPSTKGSDVVPDHTASPYPCGRVEMHHAGACECHGYHP